MSEWQIIEGDCLAVMPTLAAQSVDAIVTDPPAGIAFMGKAWDADRGGRREWVAWLTEVMAECLRVLKPGGHALVWALPRTSHWTATAIEDAGFEVRDQIYHLFGQGFPKSKNLDGEWQGWGTALKPAAEVWILARKPLIGTVAANVQAYGTGAINVDGCRVGTEGGMTIRSPLPAWRKMEGRTDVPSGNGERTQNGGRWPANVILSPEAAEVLDAQTGTLTSGKPIGIQNHRGGFHEGSSGIAVTGFGDSGGASRFFYVAKPSTKERNAGLEGFPVDISRNYAGGALNRAEHASSDGAQRTGKREPRANTHPTVKPIALMSYLCRLITPPNGTVLDPFAGSGTTGLACMQEGFAFMGIEREAEYAEIARTRLAAASQQPRLSGVA